MLVSDLEHVFSLTAKTDMQSYGISEEKVYEVIKDGVHREVSTGVFEAKLPTFDGRAIGVAYRKRPEENRIIIALVYWTRP